jgi:hypothetical protein
MQKREPRGKLHQRRLYQEQTPCGQLYSSPSYLPCYSCTKYVPRNIPSIIKQSSMALQQEHSPTRPLDSPRTKVDSYKDPSQVALYEDPNSIRFAKDSSKLVLFSLQYCDYTYPCQAQQRQDDAHQRRGLCLAQQPPRGEEGIYVSAAWRTVDINHSFSPTVTTATLKTHKVITRHRALLSSGLSQIQSPDACCPAAQSYRSWQTDHSIHNPVIYCY